MLNYEGKCTNITRDLDGHFNITFQVDNANVEELQEITKYDRLTVCVKKYKEKRSLDSNGYLWVLCSKIAEKLNTSKEEVYEDFIQSYAPCYEDERGHITITLRSDIPISLVPGHWKLIKESKDFKGYLMLRGSSEFDKTQMSNFLSHVVEEAKAQGIQTMTPQEIREMNERWGINE